MRQARRVGHVVKRATSRQQRGPVLNIATLSVHTCPLAKLGGWETGGMNVYVRELSRELGSLGHQVDIFTRRQEPSVPTIVEYANNVRVIHLDAGPPRQIDKYAVLDYLSEFACNLQRFRNFSGRRYDVMHAHYWLSGRLGLLFKDRWRAPLVSTFHTLGQMKNHVAVDDAEREDQIRIDVERRTMHGSNQLIASTESDRQQMIRWYGIPSSRVTVIPAGVDLAHFRPRSSTQARRRLELGEQPVVLFVGRIQRLKGIDVLLGATAELVRRSPGVRPTVLIVGGSPYGSAVTAEALELQRLRRLAEDLGIADVVRFEGGVQQERLPDYYSAANVTVMPSTYESFGLVALESMACGTPVVATRVGGLTSLVRDGETGYLVPWRDPSLFADRLQTLLTRPALRQTMGRRGRADAQRFGWSEAARSTASAYQGLLHREAELAGPV